MKPRTALRLADQIKALLPPDRATHYERATDWNYINTSQLVARLELPRETTDHLYTLQEEFETRRSAIYRATKPGGDRTAQLSALQQEAITRITPLLGGRAGVVEAYQQHGGGWVRYLVPQPPPKN